MNLYRDQNNASLFRRKANRPCVFFEDYGYLPVATAEDDKPIFISSEPKKIGDDAIICVEGKCRKVRLLKSNGMGKNGTYLVDMGPFKP